MTRMIVTSRRTMLGLMAAGTAAACTASRPAKVRGVMPPKPGTALFGGYVSPADGPLEQPQNAAAARDFARRMFINGRFVDFMSPFPAAPEHQSIKAGQIPMVTWSPTGMSLTDIARGRFDDVVIQRARSLRALGQPVFLRFAHEMNGTWYSWSSQHKDAARLGNTPDAFVAAWRHLRHVFNTHGADNVSWVWCPNAVDIPFDNRFELYWPGDNFVDWVGLDLYATDGALRENPRVADLRKLFSAAAKRLNPDKPLLIAELGLSGSPTFRAEQFALVPTLVRECKQLRAIVYFDRNEFSPRVTMTVRSAAQRAAAAAELSAEPTRSQR